jgi:hypothetical protein
MSRKAILWCMALTTSMVTIVLLLLFFPYYPITWSGRTIGAGLIRWHPIYASILHLYPDPELNTELGNRLRAEWPMPKNLIIRQIEGWRRDLSQAQVASFYLSSINNYPIEDTEYHILEQVVLESENEDIAINVTSYMLLDQSRATDNEALFTKMSQSTNRMLSELGKIRSHVQ